MKCIFCKNEVIRPSVEHIVPDSLGCMPEWILQNGEVCEACNNKISVVDRALIETFDFSKFTQGVKSKGGRDPKISSRGNVVGEVASGELKFYVNLGKDTATIDGKRLGGIGKSERNISPRVEIKDSEVKVTFPTLIGNHPNFSRAVHKIAFEWAAMALGRDKIIESEFDPVRNYVLCGGQDRKVILLPPNGTHYENNLRTLNKFDNGFYAAHIRICISEILVDLSPDQSLYQRFYSHLSKMMPNGGWTYSPTDPPKEPV